MQRARYARQIIQKDLKTAKVRYNNEDFRLLLKVVRYRSDVVFSDLASPNSDLAASFRYYSQHSFA